MSGSANVGTVEAVLAARDTMSPAFVAAAQRVVELKKAIEDLGQSSGPAFAKLNFELQQSKAYFDAITQSSTAHTAAVGKATVTTDGLSDSTGKATGKIKDQAEETSKAGTELDKFTRLAERMVERMLLIYALRGAFEFVNGIYEGADALVKLSAQTDLSLGRLQELQYAAAQTGVPFDKAASAVEHLDKVLGDAKMSSVDALAQIGLTLQDVFSVSADQRLGLIISRIAAMPDATQRASVEMKLFGTEGIDPVIKRFGELSEAAQKNGAVFADQNVRVLANAVQAYRDAANEIKEIATNIFVTGIQMTAIAAGPSSGQAFRNLFAGAMTGGVAGLATGLAGFFAADPENQFVDRSFMGPRLPGSGPGSGVSQPTGGNSQQSGPVLGWDYIEFLHKQSMAVTELTGEQWAMMESLRAMNELTADNAARMGVNSVQYKQYTDMVKDWTKAENAAAAEQRKLNEALEAADGLGTNWHQTLWSIDGVVVDLAENMLRAGYPVGKLVDYFKALGIELSPSQVRAITNSMKEWDQVMKALGDDIDRVTGRNITPIQNLSYDPSGRPILGSQEIGHAFGTNSGLGYFGNANSSVLQTPGEYDYLLQNLGRFQSDLPAIIERSIIGNADLSGMLSNVGRALSVHLARGMTDAVQRDVITMVRQPDGSYSWGNGISGATLGYAGAQGAMAGAEIASNGGTMGHQLAQLGMASAGAGISAGIAAGSIGAGVAAGAATAGVGAAVIGAILLYQHMHEADFRAVGEQLGRDFGVAVSEEMQNTITDYAHDHGVSLYTSERLHLSDIIDQAGGLNPGNIQQMTNRFQELFGLIGLGQADMATVSAVVEDNFAKFADASTDSLGRVSIGLRNIIDLAQEYGVDSKAIREWQRGQATSAASGISAVIGVGATDSQGLADNSSMAQMGVAAQMATGVSFADAVRSESDALIELQKNYRTVNIARAMGGDGKGSSGFDPHAEELAHDITALQTLINDWDTVNHDPSAEHDSKLARMKTELEEFNVEFEGLTEDAGTRTLFIENQLVRGQGTLLSGLSGLSQSVISFDNLGIETTGMFEAQERQGYSMYVRLQGAVHELGGDTREALIPMQGWLHDAADEAHKLGIPLDQNTQMMIDQSKELGLWHDKADPAATATERLALAVERLVNWLDHIPENTDTTVTTHFEQTGTPPTGIPPGQPGNDGGGNNGSGADPGDPTPPPGVYHGGPVRYLTRGGPVAWRPAGRDTVAAMLDPEEGVVTSSGMSRIGESGLKAINSGITSSRPVASNPEFRVMFDMMRSEQAARDNMLLSLPGMISRSLKEAMQDARANQ